LTDSLAKKPAEELKSIAESSSSPLRNVLAEPQSLADGTVGLILDLESDVDVCDFDPYAKTWQGGGRSAEAVLKLTLQLAALSWQAATLFSAFDFEIVQAYVMAAYTDMLVDFLVNAASGIDPPPVLPRLENVQVVHELLDAVATDLGVEEAEIENTAQLSGASANLIDTVLSSAFEAQANATGSEADAAEAALISVGQAARYTQEEVSTKLDEALISDEGMLNLLDNFTDISLMLDEIALLDVPTPTRAPAPPPLDPPSTPPSLLPMPPPQSPSSLPPQSSPSLPQSVSSQGVDDGDEDYNVLLLLLLLLVPVIIPALAATYAALAFGPKNVLKYMQYRFSHGAVWFPFCYLPEEERLKMRSELRESRRRGNSREHVYLKGPDTDTEQRHAELKSPLTVGAPAPRGAPSYAGPSGVLTPATSSRALVPAPSAGKGVMSPPLNEKPASEKAPASRVTRI